MLHFGNNVYLKSNEKVKCIVRINVQEPTPCSINNVTILANKSVGPPNVNVGPSLPFHPLHFLFFHSFQVTPRMQKIGRSIRKLIFSKMRGVVSKEEAKRLSQQDKYRQKDVVK